MYLCYIKSHNIYDYFEFIIVNTQIQMSMDDSQEEDCTVYIEELKSDNPSLKINAATKLPVIASVLGRIFYWH